MSYGILEEALGAHQITDRLFLTLKESAEVITVVVDVDPAVGGADLLPFGCVNPMRTSRGLWLISGTSVEQSWRHSARTAALLSVKLSRE